MGGSLLDTIYDQELKRVIGTSLGTLMLDGWSTKSNDPVLAASLVVNGEVFLIGADDTTGCPHTRHFLLEVFKEYMQHWKEL